MLSPSLLSLGVLSLASLAQAVAFPKPNPTIGLVARASATFTSPIGNSTSTGMAIGVIVAIAVVVICGVCGCCGMIWWFCARHRKNMRRIRAGNDMTPVIPREQAPPQTAHSNIVPPPGQYPPGSYFEQNTGPQGHFDPKMSPQTPSTAIITPMSGPGTPYQQLHQTGNQAPPPQEPIHEMPDNPAPIAELKG